MRFLQVVSAVVVTAFKGPCKGCVIRASYIKGAFCHWAATIFGMACRTVTEPGFGVAAAVNTVELEGGIFHHGIHVFGNNEGTRNIVTDLDAQTRLDGDILRNIADHDCARRTVCSNLIALLITCRSVCTGKNCPFRGRLAI